MDICYKLTKAPRPASCIIQKAWGMDLSAMATSHHPRVKASSMKTSKEEFHRDKLEGQQIFNPRERVEGRSEPSAQVHGGGGVSKHYTVLGKDGRQLQVSQPIHAKLCLNLRLNTLMPCEIWKVQSPCFKGLFSRIYFGVQLTQNC